MTASDPKGPSPEPPRLVGPVIGAIAVLSFLAICIFAYVTFEPDVIEDETEAEEDAVTETE